MGWLVVCLIGWLLGCLVRSFVFHIFQSTSLKICVKAIWFCDSIIKDHVPLLNFDYLFNENCFHPVAQSIYHESNLSVMYITWQIFIVSFLTF